MEEILSKTKELTDLIRAYTASQKELWQQVPYLALQAHDNDGDPQKLCAYKYGYWRLRGTRNSGVWPAFVDCADGRLVDPYTTPIFPERETTMPRTACDIAISEYILDPSCLDAKRVIRDLKEEARRPYMSYQDPKKIEQWRKNLEQELKLGKIYTR